MQKRKRLLRESNELEHSRGETHYAPWGRAGVVIKMNADDDNDIIILFLIKIYHIFIVLLNQIMIFVDSVPDVMFVINMLLGLSFVL